MYALFENNVDMINKTRAFLRKHVYDKKEIPVTKYYCVRSKLTGFLKILTFRFKVIVNFPVGKFEKMRYS